jgi:hypothetical protein
MSKSLNTTSRREEIPAPYGLFRHLMALLRRRRPSGVSHLSDAMLRDIGLTDNAGSARLRRDER